MVLTDVAEEPERGAEADVMDFEVVFEGVVVPFVALADDPIPRSDESLSRKT